MGHLFAPVDIASLVFFRIAFGVLMLWEVWIQFDNGLIQRNYIDPTYHFTFYGFSWVQPWSGNGMYLHFLALGVLAVCIALGLWYRVSVVLFFVGFTYVFLLDQALYLNHFYLICLVSFVMIFIPAHRAFSVDALLRPGLRSGTAPSWALFLLAAQMGIVYFYGGLAKLNGDWLRGEPMRTWLAAGTDFPVIGSLFTEEWMVYLFSYGGLLLDLLIVPLLLWRRTRLFAFAFVLAFHLANAQMFTIGVFPYLAIAATALFLPPSWPRRFAEFPRSLWRFLQRSPRRPASECETEEQQAREGDVLAAQPNGLPERLRARQWLVVSLLGVFLAVQLLVPLRHFLYPGDALWTNEGYRFAWRMKLTDVQGTAVYQVTDPESGRTWEIYPRDHLTARQAVYVMRFPDMALQFGHVIANSLQARGYEQIEVRATVMASLNGRDPQLLIDPTVDLAEQPRTLAPAPWILPLEEPLPSQASG
ncbi:MAG: HTTM domain-containing protein [Actinomycetota bacterium]|nr:HTTM domain-containing protein [Actinomycetota bacterium]